VDISLGLLALGGVGCFLLSVALAVVLYVIIRGGDKKGE
jgi:hypothetical protein